MNRIAPLAATLLLSLAWCLPASADSPPQPAQPAWEQLDPAQRELLIAPLRERWNSNPEDRQKMLDRAGRWQQLSPEQRRRAHQGMDRWKHMNPEQRDAARTLYSHMRTLEPEARATLKRHWKQMSVDERREWVRNHPAPSAGD